MPPKYDYARLHQKDPETYFGLLRLKENSHNLPAPKSRRRDIGRSIMSTVLSPDLCVFLALPEEASALLPRMRFGQHTPTFHDLLDGHISGHLKGQPISITCSGAGSRNASLHFNFICGLTRADQASARLSRAAYREQIPIRRLLIAGFASGLTSHLPPGSLIITDKVQDIGQSQPAYLPDAALLAAAETVSVPGVRKKRGGLVTAAQMPTTPQEKHCLGERTGAIALDRETAAIARAAQAQNIPWLCVRAITDTADERLPFDFTDFTDEDGTLNRGRLKRAMLTHPWTIPALKRLDAHTSLAAKNLAMFTEGFLAALPREASMLA
jgi:adenosylhomocysteine nucleosidase